MKLRPGQLCTINNKVYRAQRRTNGCSGCDLNNFFKCPNIGRKNKPDLVNCYDGIILKRVWPKEENERRMFVTASIEVLSRRIL